MVLLSTTLIQTHSETYADGSWVQLVKQTSGNQITVSVAGTVLTFTDATGGVSTSFTLF